MSVSSVGSMASVSHHGEQVSLDRALEVTVNDIIRHLNHVQLGLRGTLSKIYLLLRNWKLMGIWK